MDPIDSAAKVGCRDRLRDDERGKKKKNDFKGKWVSSGSFREISLSQSMEKTRRAETYPD